MTDAISCEQCGAAFIPTEEGLRPTCICHLERDIWAAKKYHKKTLAIKKNMVYN